MLFHPASGAGPTQRARYRVAGSRPGTRSRVTGSRTDSSSWTWAISARRRSADTTPWVQIAGSADGTRTTRPL